MDRQANIDNHNESAIAFVLANRECLERRGNNWKEKEVRDKVGNFELCIKFVILLMRATLCVFILKLLLQDVKCLFIFYLHAANNLTLFCFTQEKMLVNKSFTLQYVLIRWALFKFLTFWIKV